MTRGLIRAANVKRATDLRNNQNPIASLSLRQEDITVKASIDVVQGTLDLLILKALSLDPVHAWGISARVAELSRGAFDIGQGSLYPAVHRFENRGWVTS